MQEVETEGAYFVEVPGGPPWVASKLRWGAVLGGAVALVSVSLFLWCLAFAITSLATSPFATSTRASGLALWICAMAATVVGAIAGGWSAGRSVSGASRGWGGAHGFAAWAVSLLFSFGVQFFLFREVMTAAVFQTIGGEQNVGSVTRADAEHAARVAHDYFVVASWSWVGTWLVAGIAAALAGAVATNWSGRLLRRRTIEPTEPAGRPLTHSPAQ